MTTSPPPDESDRPDPEQRQPDDLSDPQAIEAAFDAIVAGIDQDTGGAPWPPAEGDPPADSPPKPTDVDRPVRTPRPDWEGWDDIRVPAPEPDDIDEPDELDDADDEHYVPPAPPPVPRGDRIIRWAWAGAVGAPLLAIVLPLIGWQIDGLVGALLVAAFLGGFVTLVSRLRSGPRIDDGPDDGAIV